MDRPPHSLPFVWEGDCFRPANPWAQRQADNQFVIGETSFLGRDEPRSAKSHAHFFAEIAEMHLSLPDYWRMLLPSPEHLRKFALIRAGRCDTQTYPCTTRAEAERWAERLRPMDTFAIIDVQENVVVRHVAHSQAHASMRGKEFQRSKDECFRIIAEMLGVETPRRVA